MSQCALVRARVTDSSQHFTLSIIKCILSAGENILKGNSPCLGTSWWVSYTQVSPYISDQSPSKSSYFTLISASSSRIDSENIFDLFRLFCVFLHRSGINSFDFQYFFFIKNSFAILFLSGGQSLTSWNCSDMFASFVVQFTKFCEPHNSTFLWIMTRNFLLKSGKIDKAIIICAEMRELIHT